MRLVFAEKRDDRVHPTVVGGSAREIELREDMADVRLDCLRGHDETLRDTAVGQALGHQSEHIPFARR